MTAVDILVTDHGRFWLIHAQSEAGRAWIEVHLPCEARVRSRNLILAANAAAIASSFAPTILAGIEAAGLTWSS